MCSLQILISKTVNTKYWKKEWTCLEISLEARQEHSLQNVAIISQDFLPYPWRCWYIHFCHQIIALFCSFHLVQTNKCGDRLSEQYSVYLLIPIGYSIFWVMSSCPNIEEEWWEWCSPKETIVVEVKHLFTQIRVTKYIFFKALQKSVYFRMSYSSS